MILNQRPVPCTGFYASFFIKFKLLTAEANILNLALMIKIHTSCYLNLWFILRGFWYFPNLKLNSWTNLRDNHWKSKPTSMLLMALIKLMDSIYKCVTFPLSTSHLTYTLYMYQKSKLSQRLSWPRIPPGGQK